MRARPKSLIAVLVFVLVTASMIFVTGATFARWRWQDDAKYYAIFTDAAGLQTGVDVRASGVTVGTVDEIELSGKRVKVAFTVPADLPLTTTTEARIRYANLTGDRYLDLTPGENPAAPALPVGGTIAVERTQPALDLDTLFAGFDPLMQALDAEEVNQLTANILGVAQGQAGSIEQMLDQVGAFTTHLADRDELIGNVITHLTRALGTIDDNKDQVDTLIVGFDRLLDGLATDRRVLGKSLDGINRLAVDTADFLVKIRPDLKANVDQLGVMSKALNENVGRISEILELYPSTIQRLGRGGAYGSFFNFFLCSAQVQVTLPGMDPILTPRINSDAKRCTDPEVTKAP